ncbi:fasciclin domain-containing protein [Marinilabilia salmonicolor]|uniref:fasciclin domain-containing protein n=2 Tax=Marinilabilia salmonicolor TaxID=989 RepID=UPI00046A23E6|nr:fasciclin domain-containing protein [Marinilabilia salmonicolor]
MKHFTKNLRFKIPFRILTFVALFLVSFQVNAQTVVDIIVNSADHTTLETAVVAAGLDDDLSGEGPFTVFAPTDAAFDALPAGTLDDLLADPTGALANVLIYHVVAAEALSTSLSDGQIITTMLGKDIEVTITGGDVFINDAQVTMADIDAANGIVHVIDAVLIPPTTVVDIINDSPDHATLEAALQVSELDTPLNQTGPFTVFAPTDAAFDALPAGLLDELLADPTGELANILRYHVVQAEAASSSLSDGDIITTMLGDDIHVTINVDGVFINNAEVTAADIHADNGIVHVIDAVLTPTYDVNISETVDYGKILTDVDGNTLYFFTLDADGTSVCIDGCLDNWPVFYSEDMIIPAELDESDFGSIDRGSGVMQTTYKGWPLYYFINDHSAGDIVGEGVNAKWYVAKPDYTIMLVDNQLTGLDGNDYTSTYEHGTEVTQYFVDDYGNTLYTWINDYDMRNMFTAEDFSNNSNWPIYEETEALVPSDLNVSDFGSINVYGRDQLTFKGWPLYFFGQDMNRGENQGVSAPSPGVWPVAVDGMMAAPAYTVVDVIVNSPDHTTLETALLEAGLEVALSGEGPFTVFAPTDAAFDALPAGTLDDLLADPSGALTEVLLYHVVEAEALSSSVSDGQVITTMLGKDIEVTIVGGDVFINGAQVTVADIETDNGVVHVIDAVLIPPTTVVDIINDSPDHTTLETALEAAELDVPLNQTGPFTVFAPTDAAFDALPAGVLDDLLADPAGDLTDILLYHVVAAEALSTSLSDGQVITTMLGKDIEVTITGGDVFINGAQVTVADIETDNGVVHVIDAVLIPPTTVVDVINDSPDHTTLETALEAAELDIPLNQTGPFTVFAPTDAAFDALPAGVLDDLLADPTGDLTDILLYHVVAAEALSTSLSDGQVITTMLGKDIEVTITGGDVFINGAQVTVADIQADNGVVHVIDAVLTPPVITVFDIISASADHTTLETALIEAQLDDDLQGEGPFTVFAPTDAAFDALPDGVLSDLLSDPTGALADVLLYHVVAGTAMSTSLSDGQNITTLLDEDVVVTLSGGDVYINDAMVTLADIESDNGVVHVINVVLIPGTNTNTSNMQANMEGIKIFPNPSSSYFNIAFSADKASPTYMEIFNILGQKVFARDFGILPAGQHSFNQTLNGFDSGAYFVIITSDDNRYVSKLKIIK